MILLLEGGVDPVVGSGSELAGKITAFEIEVIKEFHHKGNHM